MNQFMPGLELNRRFYNDVVQPLLAARFPDLVYSAGLIGYGSDVLGYDTAISTDHEWGPRLLIFLRDEEYPKLHQAIGETLSRELPPSFRGYPTNFSEPFGAGAGVRLLEPGEPGQINHHISVMTATDLLEWELGVRSVNSISTRDWLKFPGTGQGTWLVLINYTGQPMFNGSVTIVGGSWLFIFKNGGILGGTVRSGGVTWPIDADTSNGCGIGVASINANLSRFNGKPVMLTGCLHDLPKGTVIPPKVWGTFLF